MNNAEYLADVLRTADSGKRTQEQRLSEMALGLASEAGEVADIIKKELFQFQPCRKDAMVDELGDALFYLTYLAYAHRITIEEVMEYNVAKRKKRYPNGFVKGGGIR